MIEVETGVYPGKISPEERGEHFNLDFFAPRAP